MQNILQDSILIKLSVSIFHKIDSFSAERKKVGDRYQKSLLSISADKMPEFQGRFVPYLSFVVGTRFAIFRALRVVENESLFNIAADGNNYRNVEFVLFESKNNMRQIFFHISDKILCYVYFRCLCLRPQRER